MDRTKSLLHALGKYDNLRDEFDDHDIAQAKELCADRNVDVNERDTNMSGYTPLIYCARKARDDINERGVRIGSDHVDIMESILDHSECEINTKNDYGLTALNVICVRDKTSVLAAKSLLQHRNINVNLRYNAHYSPLMNCARYAMDTINEHGGRVGNDHVEIMRLLLDNEKCDINLKNDLDETALSLLCDNDKPSVLAAKMLLNHPDIDVTECDRRGNSLLTNCARNAKDNVNGQGDGLGNGHVTIMRMILENGKCEINSKNKEDKTALSELCSCVKPSALAAKILLGHPDINIEDASIVNFASYARDRVNEKGDRIGNDYVDTMRLILDYGKCDINLKNNDKRTALGLICDSNEPSILAARMLLDHPDIDVTECDERGNSLLTNSACNAKDNVYKQEDGFSNEHVTIMRMLLDHGNCKINLKNEKGKTALNELCSSLQPSARAAKILLEHPDIDMNGASLMNFASHAADLVNKNGDRVGNDYVEIMRLLLKSGKCKINSDLYEFKERSALRMLLNSKKPSTIAARMLLEHPDIILNRPGEHHSTLMQCARQAIDIDTESGDRIGNEHVTMMKLLLEHEQCDVNFVTSMGETVLHILLQNDDPSVFAAKMLLEHSNINVNKFDGSRDSPLMICVRKAQDSVDRQGERIDNNHVIIMKLILDHFKCEINLKNYKSQTELNVLCSSPKPSVLAARNLLMQRKIDVNERDHKGDAPLMNCANGAEVQIDENGIAIENSKSMTLKEILRNTQNSVDISEQNNDGFTVLHILMQTTNSTNNKDTLEILTELMNHPDIHDCMMKLDNNGRSVLDIFLLNATFNAYDINITESGKTILGMLLTVTGLVTLSKMTLAIAATVASPLVFQMLTANGADKHDTLLRRESTAHCVIQRNSIAKSKILFPRRPNLRIKWNYASPPQMAKAIRCKTEISKEIHVKNRRIRRGGLDQIKEKISCKVRINLPFQSKIIEHKQVSLVVKDNQQFLHDKQSNEAKKKILQAVDQIFLGFSKKLKKSPDMSDMAFTHSLSGSMSDNTKCYLPNEVDILCIFDGAYLFTIHTDSEHRTCVKQDRLHTCWKAYCTNRYIDVRQAAQAFYEEFAQYCHEFQPSKHNSTKGIRSILFQYMGKISLFEIEWGEGVYNGMKIKVDVVPVLPVLEFEAKNGIPFGVTNDTYHAIFKTNRHDYLPKIYFPISYSSAECQIMTSLPEPIRQGFITAKAVRLTSICAPGLDLSDLHVVEDLNIEDYLTSHILKNCLLLLLQAIYNQCPDSAKVMTDENIFDTFMGSHCKYAIADVIYKVLQWELQSEKKHLRIWHGNPARSAALLSCESCVGHDNICCRKREIRLALTQKIRTWLTNENRLSELHEGDECNCPYSKDELEFYYEVVNHLNKTGKLLRLPLKR